LNLGTHYVPQWENLEPGGNWFFPRLGQATMRKHEDWLRRGNMEIRGTKMKWTNAV